MVHLRRSFWIVALTCLCACRIPTPRSPGAFVATVNSAVVPTEPTILTHGRPEPVAASRDANGVQSEFLQGIVLLKPRGARDLQSFLDRYDGAIVSDDTIPEPPPGSGVTLTAEDRKPVQYKIRINLARVNVARLPAQGTAAGLTGIYEFSSEDGRRTFGGILDARAAGFRVSRDYVYEASQAFPFPLFKSDERPTTPGPPPVFNDPLNPTAYPDFGATGNGSNVSLAWQFIAAHGVQRRTSVAIIDSGFYLDPEGRARGTDSDFPPAPGRPRQHDFDFDDEFAGDTNSGKPCGPRNPCWWHGTGSAGVATGIANNRLGEMGTGGQIADPILLRVNGTKAQRNSAIRTAIGWGADVVSMSYGGQCDVGCRRENRDDNPFDDAVGDGKKVVFVASAGNGQGDPAVGFNVNDLGASSFYHPCIEDHVICVGALVPGGITKELYSNFGDQVLIFAPTDIPVMSYPPSTVLVAGNKEPQPLPLSQADGPPVPQVFRGTSASAPFVAGVIAMMKAVNPELDHNAVAQILRDTARPGVAPANRVLDAYAAVRRAAGVSAIVKDALENNDLETIPTNLGSLPPYSRSNLNIDKRDRDYFRFDSPNGSEMTITTSYPQGLGALAVHSLESQRGVCEPPTLVGATGVPPGGGRIFAYRVPGGPLRLALRAEDVNAYNMTITFTNDAYPSDFYEENDIVARAKRLSSRRSIRSDEVIYLTNDPRVTIDATIHSRTDIDFYIVKGVPLTSAERIFIAGFPSLQVYGNDSLINLEVFELTPENTAGKPVASLPGAPCGPTALEVRLDEDKYYLVKVTGSPGRYTLRNSVDGDPRRFPLLSRDRIYEVLHPGEPVEHVLRFPEILVFAADRAFNGVRNVGQSVHLRLSDARGKVIADGVAGYEGETLSLADVSPGRMYAVEVTSTSGANRPQLSLQWDAVKARRTSGNLILNPGAEIVGQDQTGSLANWRGVDKLGPVRRLSYGEGDDNPSPTGPGPNDRGARLFASGAGNAPSGIQQSIPVDRKWKHAIDQGRVIASFSGFIGGSLETPSLAMVSLRFLNANGQQTGDLLLPGVGSREREDKTGTLPVESRTRVPSGTRTIRVDIAFGATGGARQHQAFTDNLELILSEHSR
jgi:hypothetical protein